METNSIWFTIICSLFSGLVGSLITMCVTLYFQQKKEKRDYKMEVFRSLIGSRNDLIQGHTSTGVFERATNEIFIAFCGCKPVIEAFEDFRKCIGIPNSDLLSKLITMLKAMAEELNIEYQFANDDLFSKPLQIGTHVKSKLRTHYEVAYRWVQSNIQFVYSKHHVANPCIILRKRCIIKAVAIQQLLFNWNPAATYSPGPFPAKYHRR